MALELILQLNEWRSSEELLLAVSVSELLRGISTAGVITGWRREKKAAAWSRLWAETGTESPWESLAARHDKEHRCGRLPTTPPQESTQPSPPHA